MSVLMAVCKTRVPLLDPDSRKQIGHDTREHNKSFAGSDSLVKVSMWARSLGATNVTLVFETEQP